MNARELHELVEKLRARVASMQRTLKECEEAVARSASTDKAVAELRQSLATAKQQLAHAESRLKPTT